MKEENIRNLLTKFKESPPEVLLKHFLEDYGSRIALASSIGAEDQALSHMLLKINPGAKIFVIDTGRLHQETYTVIDNMMKRYSMCYEVYFPESQDVEEMVSSHGPNLFYESIEKRQNCCHVRKIKPLKRALGSLEAWIVGLRKEQAVTRTSIEKIEWDETNGLVKLNPLADWTTKMVWDYINANDIPYNKLHDEGFPSIGCAPCTRAIKEGEDIRAGRWWWESPEHKECGLHYRNGKAVSERQE